MLTSAWQLKAQSQEETQKWMQYMTPSDMQKMLAKSSGEWNEELTFWMDPTHPEMEQKMTASCTNSMILGGRYQQTVHKGDFGGMPFEGIETLGYDNLLKKFVSTWIDNMGTGMMYMEGSWDEATKTVVFTGRMTDPASGKEVGVRQVFKIIDDDTHEVTQYQQDKDGKEFKSMYIKLTRKK